MANRGTGSRQDEPAEVTWLYQRMRAVIREALQSNPGWTELREPNSVTRRLATSQSTHIGPIVNISKERAICAALGRPFLAPEENLAKMRIHRDVQLQKAH